MAREQVEELLLLRHQSVKPAHHGAVSQRIDCGLRQTLVFCRPGPKRGPGGLWVQGVKLANHLTRSRLTYRDFRPLKLMPVKVPNGERRPSQPSGTSCRNSSCNRRFAASTHAVG